MKTLLTEVITSIVNERQSQNNKFGISIVNLPDIDYATFIEGLSSGKKLEIYFLGYSAEQREQINNAVRSRGDVALYYSVEEAERSRNRGSEDVFRINFIKNTDMEKISSLRWFDEIDMEFAYKKGCKYARVKLAQSNEVLENLLRALARKDVRGMLNFEKVFDYIEALIETPAVNLPQAVSGEIFRLGLLADPKFCIGAPSVEQIVESIKHNLGIVKRISNLEQRERQNIASYLSNNPNANIVRYILDYYSMPRADLLKKMELAEVENCLRAVVSPRPARSMRKSSESGTVAAARMIFDGHDEQIDSLIEQAGEKIDARPDKDKSDTIRLEADGMKVDVPIQITTEKLTDMIASNEQWGGILEADVPNPKEALDGIEKYEFTPFDGEYIKKAKTYLRRAAEYPEAERAAAAVLDALETFCQTREVVLPYGKRLQDMPMLQVVAKCRLFSDYLNAYERLLSEIKDNYRELDELDSLGAKEVVGTLLSLDMVYILGKQDSHAIPTPFNPLYLWKYIKLTEELLNSRGVSESEDCFLSQVDKDFVIRKAEDIPDPLALLMLPKNEITRVECLPYAGRLGCLPIYSTRPQINDNNIGLSAVKQGIVRYMCLYPHASILLRITFINPPSVGAVVNMLKQLDRDKEFGSFGDVGIDLTIYRTKETSADWIEIEDKLLNEGMLGRVKGKKSGAFNLSIKNKRMTYQEVLTHIACDQHIIVVFDPNEREVRNARNNRYIHIHPLCVPKVYEYNKMRGDVKIRAANEGGVFADYASIIEKLYEQPSTFGHRDVYMDSPLKKETYNELLAKTNWLMILDQNLHSWDISLQSAGERLFYRNSDFRSIGIYSKCSQKFAAGYREIISSLGNYIPSDTGISRIIETTRAINDDGLLSLASHSTNQIFDQNHGKGSLGLALAAMHYMQKNPKAILVGLDTQLAREWLAEREDGKLPDLVGIRLPDDEDIPPVVDIIEVKTFEDYTISSDGIVSGSAVEQVEALETLILEMFGRNERTTTVSRREILREQVFESLFRNKGTDSNRKQALAQGLNKLFAGEYSVSLTREICHVDFTAAASSCNVYVGDAGEQFTVEKLGADMIQEMLSAYITEANLSNALLDAPSTGTDGVENPPETNNPSPAEELEQVPTNMEAERQPVTETHMHQADEDADEAVVDDLHEKCVRLNVVLRSYGIQAQPVDEALVQQTARFTRFKVELKTGETESNLRRRSEDIARELEAAGEVFISRIHGTRYIALDIPFLDDNRPLMLIDHLELLPQDGKGLFFLGGQTPDGEYKLVDLAKAPHMLIAGTTGSGKSIFLYSILVSLLQQYSADDLELLIVDPKQTDFQFFDGLPHLRGGHVLTDAGEAIAALEAINTIDKQERTELLKTAGSRDIEAYNAKNPTHKMKRLVVVIDEYADLVQAAELQGRDVRKTFESNLCMLAQRVRNLGIHLVIATQQPRATIVTSTLKAVLPFRVSFRLPSHTDSQTILDKAGAEDLLGKGDMLMMTDSDTLRMQGFYISEEQLTEYTGHQKR